MIISCFLLFLVIRSNRMTDFVNCSITAVETDYGVEDERGLCVNCNNCKYKNNDEKYSIEFCLPNENCTVLDCCTCKYHCEENSWTKHKKCQNKLIKTNHQAPSQNYDVSKTFSLYNFLPILLLVFLIFLIVLYWKKSRNYCRDLNEKTYTDLCEIQTENSCNPVTSTSTSVINREELRYDVIPLNFDLDDLEYDDHHASLFKATSSPDDIPKPSSLDDKQTTDINDNSPRCSLTLSFDSNHAVSDAINLHSFAKSPLDESPPTYHEAISIDRSTPEIHNVPENEFSPARDHTN